MGISLPQGLTISQYFIAFVKKLNQFNVFSKFQILVVNFALKNGNYQLPLTNAFNKLSMSSSYCYMKIDFEFDMMT